MDRIRVSPAYYDGFRSGSAIVKSGPTYQKALDACQDDDNSLT